MGILPIRSQIVTLSKTVTKDPSVSMASGEGAWRSGDGWHLSMSRWPPEKRPRGNASERSVGSLGPLRRVVLSARGGCQDEPENKPVKTRLTVYMETTDNRRIKPNKPSLV